MQCFAPENVNLWNHTWYRGYVIDLWHVFKDEEFSRVLPGDIIAFTAGFDCIRNMIPGIRSPTIISRKFNMRCEIDADCGFLGLVLAIFKHEDDLYGTRTYATVKLFKTPSWWDTEPMNERTLVTYSCRSDHTVLVLV